MCEQFIDKFNIVRIRSWDSAYRFAGSFVPQTFRPFRQPPKRVFNRRRLSFASLRLDESFMYVYVRLFTHVYVFVYYMHINLAYIMYVINVYRTLHLIINTHALFLLLFFFKLKFFLTE